MNDNKRKLYDALSQDYDLGTFEQFESDIADAGKRRKLYDATIEEYDFGDFAEFENQLGFAPQAQSAPQAVAAPQPAPQLEADKSAYTFTAEELGIKDKPEKPQGTVWGEESIATVKLPEIKPINVKLSERQLKELDKPVERMNLLESAQLIRGSFLTDEHKQAREEFERGLTPIQRMQMKNGAPSPLLEVDIPKNLKYDYDFKKEFGYFPYGSDTEFWNFLKTQTGEEYQEKIFGRFLTDNEIAKLSEDARRLGFWGTVGQGFKSMGHNLKGLELELAEGIADIFDDEHAKENINEERERIWKAQANYKPTAEGFGGFVAEMIPQMTGTAAGLAASYFNPYVGAAIIQASTASQVASAMGATALEARQAGASDAQTATAMLLSGAFELLSEEYVNSKYIKRIMPKATDVVAEAGEEALEREMNNLLTTARKELGGKFTAKTAKDLVGDMFVEGASEFSAEAMQALIPIIYENKEDYPTIVEVLDAGFEGFKGGIFMGGIFGGTSSLIQNRANNQRRREQGFVDVANVEIGGKPTFVEILGKDKDGNFVVLNGDETVAIKESQIKERKRFDYNDFRNAEVEYAREIGYEQEPTGENAVKEANEYTNARNEVVKVLSLAEDADVDAMLEGRTAEEIAMGDTEVEDVVNNYIKARARRDGFRERYQEERDRQFAESDRSVDERTNNGTVYGVATENGEAFITSGTVVLNEEGEIDYANSEGLVVMFPDGTKKPVKRGSLPGKVTVQNAEEMKAAGRASIEERWRAELESAENAYVEQQKRAEGVVFDITDKEGTHRVEVVKEGDEMSNILVDGEAMQISTEMLNALRGEAGVVQTENGEVKTENQIEVAPVVEAPAQIPTEKRGKEERAAYHMVPIERTMEDLHDGTLEPDEIVGLIDARIKEAESDVKAVEKKKPVIGADKNAYVAAKQQWQADMEAAKAKLDYYNQLKAINAEVTRSEMREAVEGVGPQALIEQTPDEFVANQLGGFIKITPESFQKETGLKTEQKQMVGVIAGKDKGGVSIERAAEIILENYGDELRGLGFNGDMQDMRDMIINILSNGNPRSYAKKGAEMRAQESVDGQLSQLEGIAIGMNFKDTQEMIEYEEAVVPRIIQDYTGFDETEYFNNLAENIEYDTTREGEGTRGGSELLQGEQAADNAGTGNIAESGQGGEVQSDVYSGGENAAPQGNQQVSSSEFPNNQNRDNVSPVEGAAEGGNAPGQSGVEEIQEPRSVEEVLENGDKRITNYNSRGEVATVATERDGKVVSVDSYDEGVLFEHTEYDGNGVSTSVTRYDKSGNVVSTQVFENSGVEKSRSGKVNTHSVIKSENEKKALRKRAEKWAKKLGVKVHVLESYDEVTDEQAKVAILEQRVPGWFAGGEVYVYMPHLINEADLNRTVVHESVAHKGIKQMLGEEFNKFLDNVWNAMSVPAKAKFLSYVGAGKNATQADRRAAADEYVAALAEKVYKKQGMTAEEKTIWQKFADWFRKKFNVDEAKAEVLSKEILTDEDIAKMIRASYETLKAESGKVNQRSTPKGAKVKGENGGDFRARKDNKGTRFSKKNYTAEEQEIIDRAKADGTYMKAPNGKPSKLSPKQWAQVRTRKFKKWFGDWETFFKKNFLLNSKPVAVLSGNEFSPIAGKVLTDQVEDYFKSIGGKAVSPLFGEVVLDRKGVDDSHNHGMGRNKAIAYAAVKSVIENGVIVDSHTNHKGRGYNTTVIAAPIEIKGERYVCMVVVRRNVNENRFYLHEVTAQKNLHNDAFVTSLAQKPASKGDIAKVLQNIVSASDDVSKIVNKNGEPMVVYHRTPNEFTTFDPEMIGASTDAGAFGRGFYLSPADFGSLYGKNLMPLFVNLKNPLMLNDANAFDVKEPFFGEDYLWGKEQAENFSAWVKENGYDGVWYENNGYDEIVATEPNQMKSATKNNGEFSAENNDIRFRKANENQEIFVSNARKAVEEIKQEKATPQQWIAMIKKNGGLKAGEEAWLGLEEWLNERGKRKGESGKVSSNGEVKGENGKTNPSAAGGSSPKTGAQSTVTKQEILDFIGENKIQIEEVEYQGSEEDLNDSRGLIAKMRGEDFADEFLKAFDIEYGEFGIYDEEKAFELYKRDNGTEAADEEEILAWAESVLKEARGDVREINDTRLGYTTNGLDNKREIALVVPTVEPYNASDEIHFGDAGGGRAVAWVRFGETTADTDETIAAKKAVNDYLAEMREKYNTLEGEETDAMTAEEIKHLQELTAKEIESSEKKARVLVIDEIQSKRHQDGREKGYKNPNAEAELEKVEDAYREAIKAERDYDAELKGKYNFESVGGSLLERAKQFKNSLTEEENAKREELKAKKNELAADYYALLNGTKGVPAAPFEKNWHELAMKRMLRLAAEEGFDKVAWTTGEQQAERYNIGAVVNRIESNDTVDYDSTLGVDLVKQVVLFTRDGNAITLRLTPEGIVRASSQYNGHHISDIVGKELGNRIMTETDLVLKEQDLRIGGEGMKGFYDKMLPSFVQKYTKKWGAKVGTVEMPSLEQNNVMHSVDITPEMKESVMEGQTMFRKMNKHAEEFNKTHKGGVPVVEIDPNNMEADFAEDGFATEEIEELKERMKKGVAAVYNTDKKIIYLLVPSQDKESVYSTCWHEDTHAAIDFLGLTPEMMDEFYSFAQGKKKEAFEALLDKIGYEIEEYPEESLAYGVQAMHILDNWGAETLSKLFGSTAEGAQRQMEIIQPLIDYINNGRQGTQGSVGETVRDRGMYNNTANQKKTAETEGTGATATGGLTGGGVTEQEERTLFRKAEQMGEDEVVLTGNAVAALGERLNVPVRVVDDVESLPEKRKNKKGWFENGEVVVVMDNHVSMEDAMQTVLHEVVGRKGLRAVMGEEFDALLDVVYRNLPKGVKSRINYVVMTRFVTPRQATEEYIAGLAGKNSQDAVLNDIMQRMGDYFRGAMNLEVEDGELRYMLWKNNQRLQTPDVLSMLQDFVMETETNTGDNGTRFRVVNDTTEKYEKSVKGFWNKFKEAYYDRLRSVRKAQEIIAQETGMPISDSEDVYSYAEHLPSINKSMKEVFDITYMTPFVELLQKIYEKTFNGKKIDEKTLERYTNAKHGLERNRELAVKKALTTFEEVKGRKVPVFNKDAYADWVAKKAAILNDGSLSWEQKQEALDRLAKTYGAKLKDYSGLTAIFDSNGGMKYKDINRAAIDYVLSMEAALGNDTKALWKLIKGMTGYSLKQSYESGLLAKEAYEAISSMYEFYVPLRGFTEKTAEDYYDYVASEARPLNSVIIAASGRKSEADNIFATILNMANSAIVYGNKNRLKQRVLNLATRHNSPLLSVDNAWYIKMGDDYILQLPNITENMTEEQIAEEHARFDAIMKEKEKNGEAVRHSQGLNIGVNVAMDANKIQHAIRVKRNGREYIVWVNGSPTMANAINGMLKEDEVGFFGNAMDVVNKFRSKMVTQYSPTFVLTNLFRDVQSSSTVYGVRRGRRALGRFLKNVRQNSVKMGALYWKYKHGALDENKLIERYFKEFLENGGETGYTEMISIDEYNKMLNELTEKINIGNAPVRAIEAAGEVVEFANRCIENLCRFSAYMTSREDGVSILQSINDAKEVSVNFNRKGSGAMGAGILKRWFMFFNPAVQSVAQRILLLQNYPKRMIPIMAMELTAGAMMPYLYATLKALLFGGDDDDETWDDKFNNALGDYYNMTDYRRRSSIIFPTKDGSINPPLSHEARVLYGVGELITSIVNGHEKYDNIPSQVVNILGQSLPFNPVEGWSQNDNLTESLMKNLSPDAIKPFVEIAYNSDFAGNRIHNRSDYNEYLPEYMRGRKGTGAGFNAISKTISGGESGFERGWADRNLSVFANPSSLEHLVEGYLGGAYTFFNKAVKSVRWASGNEEFADSRNIPFVSSFYTPIGKYEENPSAERTRRDWERAFDYYQGEMKLLDGKEKAAKRGLKFDMENAAETLEAMQGGEALMVDVFNDGNKILKELYADVDAARTAKDFDKVKEIDQEIYAQKRFITERMEQMAENPMIGYTFNTNKSDDEYGQRETYGDVRDMNVINEFQRELKPLFEAYVEELKTLGEIEQLALYQKNEKMVLLYNTLKRKEQLISNNKKAMKENPEKADEYMDNIRRFRAEAVELINNYNE